VDDDVDREAPSVGVEGADAVGPHPRPLLARQRRLDLRGVEQRRVGRAGRRKLELDVVVGELAGAEAMAGLDGGRVRERAILVP
jgi:hypothetical protein